MQLEHEFVVPVPAGKAWDVLLDVERIAPCMPGATVDSFDGETVQGRVKVKVGPIQVTYAGSATFTEKDEANRVVTLDASGKEARGSGTAKAVIKAGLHEQGDSTRVTVSTDLQITGKPAQFGRGVMVEVGNKILGRFAGCLGETLAGGATASSAPSPAARPAAAETAAAGPSSADSGQTPAAASLSGAATAATAGSAAGASNDVPSAPRPGVATLPRPVQQDDAIDLLDVGGAAVVKRVAPIAVGLLVLLVLWRLVRRR